MGQLHNYGRVDNPNVSKDIFARPFYYAEQNGCLKILTVCAWKMNGLDRKAECPPISCYT